MNLEDVIDLEYGLQQDEWSLGLPRFGKESQLEVIGWSGKYGRNKYYIVKCSICSGDTEVYGSGHFRSRRKDLTGGKIPCGCSKSPRHSREQYEILCKRMCEALEYTFVGFSDNWRGKDTKISVVCNVHGLWETGRISTLLNKKCGCPACSGERIGKATLKSDEEMINSFFLSGCFSEGTRFWRSNREDKLGRRASYWFMECPDCGVTGESFSGNLQRGQRPCNCPDNRQRQCYINYLIDSGSSVALKFGIAVNSEQRLKHQASKTCYTVLQYAVYEFEDTSYCKKAERECLQELECGVVLKRDMPDGWTETTWVYNLDKIIEIYERNGGIKIENTD